MIRTDMLVDSHCDKHARDESEQEVEEAASWVRVYCVRAGEGYERYDYIPFSHDVNDDMCTDYYQLPTKKPTASASKTGASSSTSNAAELSKAGDLVASAVV